MAIRLITLLCLLACAAGARAHVTVRALELDAADASALRIQAGQGHMIVRGGAGSTVDAELVIEFDDEDWSVEEAEQLLAEALVFELFEAGGGDLRLDVRLEDNDLSHRRKGGGLFGLLFGEDRRPPRLHLEVTLPAALDLDVDDGSGALDISGLDGSLFVHDGSGAIEVRDIGGPTVIHDGSGDILAEDIGGFLEVHDGSGFISLSRLRAGADIHDGSGGIRIVESAGDVSIRDGSGDIEVRGIVGDLTVHDGSGDIDVDGVTGDALITDGSGSVSTRGVEGRVRRR